MIDLTKPFLWNHMQSIPDSRSVTSGEERPLTASANEENKSAVVDLSFLNIVNSKS